MMAERTPPNECETRRRQRAAEPLRDDDDDDDDDGGGGGGNSGGALCCRVAWREMNERDAPRFAQRNARIENVECNKCKRAQRMKIAARIAKFFVVVCSKLFGSLRSKIFGKLEENFMSNDDQKLRAQNLSTKKKARDRLHTLAGLRSPESGGTRLATAAAAKCGGRELNSGWPKRRERAGEEKKSTRAGAKWAGSRRPRRQRRRRRPPPPLESTKASGGRGGGSEAREERGEGGKQNEPENLRVCRQLGSGRLSQLG